MITNKDLEIENTSYTKKDFGQIFPETVDTVKKLTNEWDPEQTNESDPGVVILKIASFLADKINYNIDKNILENYITSATQETTFRRICDMLGYNMKYYRSATSNISFRYLGQLGLETPDESDVLSGLNRFTIKAFSTSFKTDDDIVYTLLEDINISKNEKQATLKSIIEGTLKALTVLGNEQEPDLIQLQNLDDNNRLYFPEVMVAENGVFINKDSEGVYDALLNTSAWRRVDNLNNQDLGQKVFKFSFDSDVGFPYIQFPQDIAELIGDGLRIDYVVSKGKLGSVLNNKLTKFNSIKIVNDSGEEILSKLDENKYVLSNSSSIGAQDKETLNEAYINYSKTVGVFDTLVSCRDYTDYINTFVEDLSNDRLVSNVCVTDVRTDPNVSKEIFSRNADGSYYKHVLIEQDESGSLAYNPFTLFLHGCMAVNSDISTESLYNKSYNIITESDRLNVQSELQDIKAINHTFSLPKNVDDVIIIYGDYTLKVNLSTKYKVNSYEQKQIISNVKKALCENLNATKVDMGEEIPYDTIIRIIQDSDDRIKTVNLQEPTIAYKVKINGEGDDLEITDETIFSNTKLTRLLTDNILAGRLPFYNVDKSFKLDYDIELSSSPMIYPNNTNKGVAGLVGELVLDKSKSSGDMKLSDNEEVQILEDSYNTTVSYPAYVYYSFNDTSASAGAKVIDKNIITKLTSTQHLYLHYTDSSDIVRTVEYKENDIVRSNFDIYNTSSVSQISGNVANKTATKFIKLSTGEIDSEMTYSSYTSSSGFTPFYSAGTDEQIDILEKNEVTLSSNTDCFWYIKSKINTSTPAIINDAGDILFEPTGNPNEYFYILEDGEFFIYPNEDMTTLNILSSGTKLIYSENKLVRTQSEIINIDTLRDSISDEDIGTFRKYFRWEKLPKSLTVIESSITNIISDEEINNFTVSDSSSVINSSWKGISNIIIDNKETTFSSLTNALVRSVSYLTASGENPLVLEKINTSNKKVNTISILLSNKAEDEEESLATLSLTTLSSNSVKRYLQVSPEIDSYNNCCVLSTLKYIINEEDGTIEPQKDDNNDYLHDYSLYKSLCYSLGSLNQSTKDIPNLVRYCLQEGKASFNTRGEYVISKDAVSSFLGADTTILPGINAGYNATLNIYDTVTGNSRLIPITDATPIDLSSFLDGPDSSFIYISVPLNVEVYGYLSDHSAQIKAILDNYTNFDALGEMNPYKYISSYDPLVSFFDVNNIYNKLTIARIDFNASEFNIVGTSRTW